MAPGIGELMAENRKAGGGSQPDVQRRLWGGGRNLLPGSLRVEGWGTQRFPLTEVESLDSAHRASWSGMGGLPPKEDWGATPGHQGLLGVGRHERPLIEHPYPV